MNLLHTALQSLHAWRREYLTLPVIYSRGALELAIAATPGKTEFSVLQGDGAELQAEVVDFIVTAADLKFDGEVGYPQPGDRITIPRGGGSAVFEVMSLGDQGHYRPCDPLGFALRIHTKQVA